MILVSGLVSMYNACIFRSQLNKKKKKQAKRLVNLAGNLSICIYIYIYIYILFYFFIYSIYMNIIHTWLLHIHTSTTYIYIVISILLPHLSGTSSIPGFSNLGPYLLQDKNTTDISSHPRVLLLLPGDQSSAANETLKSLRSLRRNHGGKWFLWWQRERGFTLYITPLTKNHVNLFLAMFRSGSPLYGHNLAIFFQSIWIISFLPWRAAFKLQWSRLWLAAWYDNAKKK